MNMPRTSSIVTPPIGRRVISAFGEPITLLLGPEETGGAFTLFRLDSQPGGGPPPHLHRNEDEWFHVLEGRAESFKDGAWVAAEPGTTVFTPRGVVHSYRNAGATVLRMLVCVAPSGFEVFYSRCAEEFATSGPPDMARIMQIAGEHGIEFVAP